MVCAAHAKVSAKNPRKIAGTEVVIFKARPHSFLARSCDAEFTGIAHPSPNPACESYGVLNAYNSRRSIGDKHIVTLTRSTSPTYAGRNFDGPRPIPGMAGPCLDARLGRAHGRKTPPRDGQPRSHFQRLAHRTGVAPPAGSRGAGDPHASADERRRERTGPGPSRRNPPAYLGRARVPAASARDL